MRRLYATLHPTLATLRYLKLYNEEAALCTVCAALHLLLATLRYLQLYNEEAVLCTVYTALHLTLTTYSQVPKALQ